MFTLGKPIYTAKSFLRKNERTKQDNGRVKHHRR